MSGRKKVPDYRRLVSRTPPEGLEEWVMDTQQEALDRYGLLYEVDYGSDEFDWLLGEPRHTKKNKMVRVTCSCCRGSMLLDWGRNDKYGYGFVLPEDVEGDWSHTVTVAGDECGCPMCDARVLVNKRSVVRDYYVTAETTCVSASVVGDDKLLVLTGFTVQNRTYKSGYYDLAVIPSEAYVFTPDECVQLMGWRKGYSGTAGYFIQYGRSWRQTKGCEDHFGRVTNIFGLTPELVEASCLPHCKLDVYMDRWQGIRHEQHPIIYLRLYQRHHNVEALLLHGLPLVLDEMLQNCVLLEEINWSETRPAQMLGLTKDELEMARSQMWNLRFWRLFTRTKAVGETLTREDIQNAFRLGDDRVLDLIGRGPVGKSIRYLLQQCETLAVEVDDYGSDDWIPDVSTLLDYWTMSEQLGRDLTNLSVRFPVDLFQAHDMATDLVKQRRLDALVNSFRLRRKQLKKYVFATGGFIIRPAASQRELTAEGDYLHHCVSSYGERHATGKTAIFFIRRLSHPAVPYYTLELDEKKLKVLQNRGMCNCARTPKVQAFEDLWLSWLRAGAPRDVQNKPILPQINQKNRKEVA